MNILNLFKKKPKTDRELQAELKALVHTIYAQQGMSISDREKYEKLLVEIYKRGLEPGVKIKVEEK